MLIHIIDGRDSTVNYYAPSPDYSDVIVRVYKATDKVEILFPVAYDMRSAFEVLRIVMDEYPLGRGPFIRNLELDPKEMPYSDPRYFRVIYSYS